MPWAKLFAFDCPVELEKIAAHAPKADVFCRVLVSNDGAEWPLSRKFGCEAEEAVILLKRARDLNPQSRLASLSSGFATA